MATASPERARFSCAVCGEVAGSVRLVTPAGAVSESRPAQQALAELDVLQRPQDQAAVMVETFFGIDSLPVRLDRVDAVARAIANADASALYRISHALAPFHCPDCAVSYCGEHWSWREFEDDPYTGIEGDCPQGHFQVLAY